MDHTRPPIAVTIKDQVYRILKEDICNGVYAPGQWLQEQELSKQLNVSRSPIREALRLLAGDGLVLEIPNKGVFVKEFSPRDIEEVCDLRIMMETYAILRAAPNLTAARRAALLDFISALDSAHRQQDLPDYIAADTELHNLFVVLGGNSLLVESYRKVHIMIQQFRIYSLMEPTRFDVSLDEHREIVHHILTGDLERAAALNRRHLELAKQQIGEHIEQQRALK